jgi:hypothetical protein
MNARVPPPLTWHICRIIVDSLGPIVSTCILNQSKGHWLLNDALIFSISVSLKFRNEIDLATFDNLMEKDGNVVYELSCLTSNIKKEVIQILDFFLSFLKNYEERKAHNMSDPRFKTLHLVSSFIGCEQGKAIVEEYDKKSLFPMFLKYFYHLHPLVEFEWGVLDEKVKEDKNLDIFEMTTSTNEPTTKLVNRELLIFKHYQVDVKDIKCRLQWLGKHENMFPTIGFCARQILRIVGSQIKIKRIFSLIQILINLRRCCNQKNWIN